MDKSKALTWTELRVGLVVIASLVLLAVTILYIGGGGRSPLSRTYQVRALMSDVNGLKAGAPVRVGGVEVGSVTGVDFAAEGGGGLVEVAMRLDRRVRSRVTTDSRATLGSLGMLGEKAVDITSATTGVPVDDGGYLSAAAEDPFKGLLADASGSTAHLRRILSRMDAGEGLIGKALRDEELYHRMVDVSIRLQAVMTKLESDTGPLGRLVNDEAMSRRLASAVEGLESSVRRVDSGHGTLGVLSRDEELATSLKELTGHMRTIAARLEAGEGTAGRLLADDALYEKMDGAAERLNKTLARLDEGQGTAARLLADPELYEALSAAVAEVRALVADVREDPRRYLRVKVSLF